MHFHAGIFNHTYVEDAEYAATHMDPHLVAYLIAVAKWDLDSIETFFSKVALQFPDIIGEPASHDDYPFVRGLAVVKTGGRIYGLIVVQSALFDRSVETLVEYVPWTSLIEEYGDRLAAMNAKLGKPS